MIMSMFFTTEACLFQVVTICIQWRSASSETKVHSTKTGRPLRFSELGKQRASKKSVLTREVWQRLLSSPCGKSRTEVGRMYFKDNLTVTRTSF